MKKGIRQIRHCLYCENQVKEYWYKGRFKAYSKTCKNHHGFEKRRGKLNPSWKGGKYIDKYGYIRVLRSDRSKEKGASRYILKHRLVIEKKLKRKLKSNEIVHHLNGVRKDNRIENLVVIQGPNGHETWTYHRALQERIRELEVKLKYAQGNKRR